jgi:GT2 family glycosyltransferase
VPRGAKVIVVNDASPDPALRAALMALAARRRIRLIVRRGQSTGFPAAANAGLRAAPGRDVVLLNSDTLNPPGWLEALRRAAYTAPDIGSATPLTNEGSILSYPDPEGGNEMPGLSALRRLARLASRANGDAMIDIPTGVGFCLYLQPRLPGRRRAAEHARLRSGLRRGE